MAEGRLTRAEADARVTELKFQFLELEGLVHKAQEQVAFAQHELDAVEEKDTEEWAEAEDRLVKARAVLRQVDELFRHVQVDLEGAYQDAYMAVRQ